MNGRQHRFRFGRRQSRPVTTDHLESVLSQPLDAPASDLSFEEAVLGRVDAQRPFLGKSERTRVRWVRMSIIGLALGLFASGAIGVRAGLLPFGEQAGPVSQIVEGAQSESIQQVQTVAHWRDEALAKFASIKERQRHARNNAPIRCNDSYTANPVFHAPAPATAREQGLCIGFSMQKPVVTIAETPTPMSVRYIVFDDGLALPIAGTGNAACPTQQVQIKRWPSGVQDNLTNFGLEGSSELSISGVLPPWYSADVVRLPKSDATEIRTIAQPDRIPPHQLPH
ncbi:MAG: hypothetical protein KDA31_09045 [Phycisphaerales bacterium]|nr:hypothetical protein [Phycisphaerales bacterium]MCB9836831.1 hypothetical protein [Phycisphaera sp.]